MSEKCPNKGCIEGRIDPKGLGIHRYSLWPTCPVCEGSGEVETCPKCDGEGIYFVKNSIIGGDLEYKCGKCKGNGVVPKERG